MKIPLLFLLYHDIQYRIYKWLLPIKICRTFAANIVAEYYNSNIFAWNNVQARVVAHNVAVVVNIDDFFANNPNHNIKDQPWSLIW